MILLTPKGDQINKSNTQHSVNIINTDLVLVRSC